MMRPSIRRPPAGSRRDLWG